MWLTGADAAAVAITAADAPTPSATDGRRIDYMLPSPSKTLPRYSYD